MAINAKPITIEAFEAFLNRPENMDRRFELIEGEIVEMPSNPLSSIVAIQIAVFLKLYLKSVGKKALVSGEAAGYHIGNQVYAPDLAIIDRLPSGTGFGEHPPYLVVEVISDPSSAREQAILRTKISRYLGAGITVWVVDYSLRTLEVHKPGAGIRLLEGDTKVTDDLLPGFEMPLQAVFEDLDSEGDPTN